MNKILPCDVKKTYKVIEAFAKLPRLDWKQSGKQEAGDLVFIYLTKPYQAIRYICRVTKVSLPEVKIDDSEFVVDGTNYESSIEHMELELVRACDVSLKELRAHGLKGNLQGPYPVTDELYQFIMAQPEVAAVSKANSIDELQPGMELTNKELSEIFHCGNMGGMRRSKATGTLVIISDHTKMYDDKWEGEILHYTGMGKSRDQSLEFAQNKTLNESQTNGVAVHLFEVFRKAQYTYQGKVELAGTPYQAEQEGEDHVLRKVWMFPLRREDTSSGLSEHIFQQYVDARDKIAESLTGEVLRHKAEIQSKCQKTAHRAVMTDTYIRDPYIARYAKERAQGVCQLCGMPAPFDDAKGNPYLESHHIVWLSEGGEDTIENTVALCPNCHRRMHVLKRPQDVKILQIRNK